MKIFVYAPARGTSGERLRKTMQEWNSKDMEIYGTVETLCEKLRQPREEMTFAVLLAESREELESVLSIRHLLSDIRLILILPDRDNDTIARGHSLRPRFLTYCDADFTDITAVLNRMAVRGEKSSAFSFDCKASPADVTGGNEKLV